MKVNIKNLTLITFLIIALVSMNHSAAYANYSQKIKGRLIDENLTSVSLPVFKYDRYNVELNEKKEIGLILNPEAKVVTVKVVDANPIGLTIDKHRLLKEGLKIIETPRIRKQINKKRNLITEELRSNKNTYILKRINNQQQTIRGIDYKIFKVTVKAKLPGVYTISATIDNNLTAKTTVFTNPSFRINTINPNILNIGKETIITLSGKSLDSLTEIFLEGNDIQIKEIESLEDDVLEVKVFVNENAQSGFRNVTASNPLFGITTTILNGIYVGPVNGKDGVDGMDGKQGEIGLQGPSGIDGMGICNNPQDTLMIFANNLPPGNQATSFLDPVLCNLTFGVPVGFNGYNGSDGGRGPTGATGTTGLSSLIKVINEPDGSNCDEGGIKVQTGLDSNNNNVLDSSEVATTNYVCNGDD